jgi:hypothetical protein
MPTVRRYTSPILAQHAAAYLRRHGVVATVVGHISPFPSMEVQLFPVPGRARDSGQFAVVIDSAAQRRDALLLLDEFDRSPAEVDADWELDAVPDLSLLDPELAPPCPACGEALPLDASEEVCPGCGAAVDVSALLADRYGPELLAACIAAPEAVEIPGEVLDSAALACPGCGYALRGLSREGVCPECGERYSKRGLLEGP